IDIALPAIRTAIAMLQVLVLDLDFLCATECLSPVSPVSLGRRCRALIRLRAGILSWIFRFRQHGVRLFRISWPYQHRSEGVQSCFDLLAIGFAQRGLAGSVQDPVQLVQVHIHTAAVGGHATLPSSSRNRFVNGYPRISLIDRFGT